MLKRLAAALLFFAAAAVQAAPMQYNFSYMLLGGDVLSGSLMGELQGDNNTIVVSGILDFAEINGTPGPSLPYVVSMTELLGGSGPPTVSLDGSVMDMCASIVSGCAVEGFLFDTTLIRAPDPRFSASAAFGSGNEVYDPSGWSIQAASIPEPGTLALLGLGLAGLAATRRRKQ